MTIVVLGNLKGSFIRAHVLTPEGESAWRLAGRAKWGDTLATMGTAWVCGTELAFVHLPRAPGERYRGCVRVQIDGDAAPSAPPCGACIAKLGADGDRIADEVFRFHNVGSSTELWNVSHSRHFFTAYLPDRDIGKRRPLIHIIREEVETALRLDAEPKHAMLARSAECRGSFTTSLVAGPRVMKMDSGPDLDRDYFREHLNRGGALPRVCPECAASEPDGQRFAWLFRQYMQTARGGEE